MDDKLNGRCGLSSLARITQVASCPCCKLLSFIDTVLTLLLSVSAQASPLYSEQWQPKRSEAFPRSVRFCMLSRRLLERTAL